MVILLDGRFAPLICAERIASAGRCQPGVARRVLDAMVCGNRGVLGIEECLGTTCKHASRSQPPNSQLPNASCAKPTSANQLPGGNHEPEETVKTSHQLRADAEAKFKKREHQRLDGCAAMAEYKAAGAAAIENTARLRALRMTRDAEAIAARPAPTARKLVKRRAAGKGAAR